MLQALSIRDFAIIDRLDLDLGPGLTVITGETGAGKSILVDALSLVLGDRARADVVRTGAKQASVEALFDLRQAPLVRARLVDAGLDAGDELVIRRVVGRNGRHKVYVNGALATVNTLAHLTEGLVDISGQHQHYSLMRAESHLDLLDRVAGLGALRETVEEAHREVAALDARVADLRRRQRDQAEREDFLSFQLAELREAKLDDPSEEEALLIEARRLRNSEKLRTAAAEAEASLYSERGAAAERIGKALKRVEALVALDDGLVTVLDELQQALVLVEDAARTLEEYGRGLDAEPSRLDEVEQRLALFARLRRKYGATLGEVIARKKALEAELAEISGADGALESLAVARRAAAAKLRAAAETLSAARRAGGDELSRAVCAELVDLGMPGAKMVVERRVLTGGVEVEGRFYGPRGAERVEFLLSANPGEAPQPMGRIASGGELSRIMLAVKRVIAARDPVSTYIFDEVDTGVGGPTAEAIGRKLRQVGAKRQALCVTHLPQIAAMGQQHLHVSKEVVEDRTRSVVDTLDDEGRVEELARMLGGATVTDTTRAAAGEMLRRAAAE
ncbi:MAG: DNA repair protein RecN [bacterium]